MYINSLGLLRAQLIFWSIKSKVFLPEVLPSCVSGLFSWLFKPKSSTSHSTFKGQTCWFQTIILVSCVPLSFQHEDLCHLQGSCGEGNGTPLQYSCLENPMDGGAWKAAVHEVALQSMRLRRIGHDWATSLSLFTFMYWRRKWQLTPVFLPGESQGRGSLVRCRLWGRTESDMTEAT